MPVCVDETCHHNQRSFLGLLSSQQLGVEHHASVFSQNAYEILNQGCFSFVSLQRPTPTQTFSKIFELSVLAEGALPPRPPGFWLGGQSPQRPPHPFTSFDSWGAAAPQTTLSSPESDSKDSWARRLSFVLVHLSRSSLHFASCC